MNNDKIPRTDSIGELAQFWDTHDLTDYEADLDEVAEPVFERQTVVKVVLPADQAETVERIARSKGVGTGDLIREWVLEKVRVP